MTKNETVRILAVINAAYPQAYERITEQVKADMVNLWHGIFMDDDYKIIARAVKTYLTNDTRGFIPPIGAIKEEVRKIMFPDELTEQEAVNLIMDRLGWSSAKEAFASLPPVIQRVVGSASQLNAWGYMEIDTVQSVISSNIQRSLKTMLAQERDKQRTGQVKPIVESEKLIENKEVNQSEKTQLSKEQTLEFIKKAMEAIK